MEWGHITFWELVKDFGFLAVPFTLGKYLWKKTITDEILKAQSEARKAAQAAEEAKESVKTVPPLIAEFSQEVATNLSKMSIHYAEAVRTTSEANNLVHEANIKIKAVEDKTDIELTKFKIVGGKLGQRMSKAEQDIENLKMGKIIVVGDKGKKKP